MTHSNAASHAPVLHAVPLAAALAHLPRPRMVLFDWDNTLVDTWPVIHAALEDTFHAMGQTPWTLEETRARVSRSMRDAFPELFGDRWEEAGDIYQRSYRARHLQALELLPGAEQLLQTLQRAGVPMGVVSNKKGATLREEARHMGLEHYFFALVGSDDAAADKPHAAPVLLAMAEQNSHPDSRVWFIGDTVVDLACAAATGCTPVLYGPVAPHRLDGTHGPGEFDGHALALYAPDHSALLAQVITLLQPE